MGKPSQEQIELLNSLIIWCGLPETANEVFSIISQKFEHLIKECKGKNISPEVIRLIEDDYLKENNCPQSEHSITSHTLYRITRFINKCYEGGFWGISLFKLTSTPEKAKSYLVSKETESTFPTLSNYERRAENQLLCKKIQNLIEALDQWIADINNNIDIPRWKIVPMQNKYARYKKQFEEHMTICSACVLSEYVDKPEEAKQFISEIFTKRQERFYSSLEKWAMEIADEDCSSWIRSYLEKGRDFRIKRLAVLKMIDSEDKAKSFLMSKYQNKLTWDKKKKEEREKREERHLSVFDSYRHEKSSFNLLLNNNEYDKLYAVCISANFFGQERIPSILASDAGFNLRYDTISNIFVEHLTLSATNILFYTYKSTYRKSVKNIQIYSQFGCEILKEYLNPYIDHNVLESAIGFLKHTDGYGKSYTYLLTDKQEYYKKEPIICYHRNPNKPSSRRLYDLANNNLFEQALTWKLFSGQNNTIDLTPGHEYTSHEKDLINEYIAKHYSSMSFIDKYIFGFILSGYYKCPIDESLTTINLRNNYIARIYNLWNCITNQYNTQVFEDRFFEYAKIEYQYGDQYLKKLVDIVGVGIIKYNYRDIWFESCRGKNLIYLRVLLFLNWVFVSNSGNKIKKITACWLYYIVFDALQNSYPKDTCFWEVLLSYVLIENEPIYIVLFKKIDTSLDENIVTILVKYFIKDRNDLSKGMSYDQRNYLSDNLRKSTLIKDFFSNHQVHGNECQQRHLDLARKLFNRLKELLESIDYSNDKLIEDLSELPSLPIPNNFYYHSGHSSSKPYYNGDYSGSYAHDVMGYSNSDIDTIFDGDPDAYWNID